MRTTVVGGRRERGQRRSRRSSQDADSSSVVHPEPHAPAYFISPTQNLAHHTLLSPYGLKRAIPPCRSGGRPGEELVSVGGEDAVKGEGELTIQVSRAWTGLHSSCVCRRQLMITEM